METLEQIKAKFSRPQAKSVADVNPADLPYWVIVVNPRRQPVQPKYYFGYAVPEEAERKAVELNEKALADASDETVRKKRSIQPFLYFAVARPEGGQL